MKLKLTKSEEQSLFTFLTVGERCRSGCDDKSNWDCDNCQYEKDLLVILEKMVDVHL